MSNMPVPVGWRMLVKPVKPKEKSQGGIIFAEDSKKAQEYLRYSGTVVAMGPLCYKHEKFEGGDPWCGVGDHIVFKQYQGQDIKVITESGVETYKIINDDEVICRTDDPEALFNYIA